MEKRYSSSNSYTIWIVVVVLLVGIAFITGMNVGYDIMAPKREARNVENLKKGIVDDIALIARAQMEQEKLDEHNVLYRYGPGGLTNIYKEHLAAVLGVPKEFFKEYTIVRPLSSFEEKQILYQEENGRYNYFDLRNQ
jgi:hypothetical protein